MNKYRMGGVARIDATVHFFDSPGQIECYWKLLKRGFWHVAVTLHTPRGDILVDPRMSHIDVQRPAAAQQWRQRGVSHDIHISVPLSNPPWGVLMPATCVSVVKACLGIRAWWVLTPHQLYKYLQKNYPARLNHPIKVQK